MNFTYLQTQRQKPLLIHENFIYTQHSIKNETTRWRCQTRKCLGVLYIDTNGIITNQEQHNHEANIMKCQRILINYKIQQRAKNSKIRHNDIIIEETKNISNETIAHLAKFSTLRDSITRKRNRSLNFIPNEIADIPKLLSFDHQGNKFLRFDSGVNSKSRIIIFASSYKEKYIAKSKVWLVDGTFKTSPHNFYQLLIMHGVVFGRSFPLLYILMSDKSESSYKYAFTEIKKLFTISPRVIISDLEKSLLNAINFCFPNVKSYLCLFHFGQSIWRKIQSLNLTKEYKTKADFKRAINNFVNLAFVSECDVFKAYIDLKENLSSELESKLTPFLSYFEKYYLGRYEKETNCFIHGIFPLSLWNVHKRILKSLPRTINAAEGWHRSFNHKNEIAHPNIARLIEKLKDEEEVNRILISQSLNGKFEISKRDLLKEEKLRICITNYDMYDRLEFLNAIYNIYDWKINEDE